jgi:arylsulfatase
VKTPYKSWIFDASTVRMPQFTAPGLGRGSNQVTIEADLGDNATGEQIATYVKRVNMKKP